MANAVIVHRNRTTVVSCDMGVDVSADVITSQIRSEPEHTAPLLAEWVVSYLTDGTDGELILTLDNTITRQITAASGYMDILRFSSGEPYPVFDKPLEVIFRGTVTDEVPEP